MDRLIAEKQDHDPKTVLDRVLRKIKSDCCCARDFSPKWDIAYRTLAAAFTLFLLFSAVANFWTSSTVRPVFIMLVVMMIFIRHPARNLSPSYRPSTIDALLIVLALFAFGNFAVDYQNMMWRAGAASSRDMTFGIIAVILVLEACRRVMSLVLPLLALCLLVYAYAGPYIPSDLFRHQGYTLTQIMGSTYASMDGIFGFVAYVFVAFVMLFIIMGAIFERFGAGAFYIDLPTALTGKYRGGPAKAAVVASGFFGMISGSATANTVSTGTFTIPLMKDLGYKPHVAAGIEAASSTGGMFMPPVMGAAAFLMAKMLGVPYVDIVEVAIVPALLYFFTVIVMTHLEALKEGIGVTPLKYQKNVWRVLKEGWYFLFPIAVLFGSLFAGKTASFAAFYAIVSFLVIMAICFVWQGNIKAFFTTLFDALAAGGDRSLMIASTAGPVGIIVGMAMLTGIAFKFSALVLSYASGMEWLALLMLMLATFVLGMGTTVTADYLLLAVIAVPALGKLGIPLIAAHFAVFWFSQSSNVTPPVCMAAFAGASIAESRPYKTGFQAMKFSCFLYVMPFMFVYTPILMPDGFSLTVVYTWIILFFSVLPLAAALTGYCYGRLNLIQRAVMLGGAVLIIFPVLPSYYHAKIIGALLVSSLALFQYLSARFGFRSLNSIITSSITVHVKRIVIKHNAERL